MKNLFRGAFGLAPMTDAPRAVPEVKSGQQPLVALQLSARATWSSRDYSGLVREGFQKNAIVYRCVRMIAEAAASVPLCVRRGETCEAGDPARRRFWRAFTVISNWAVMLISKPPLLMAYRAPFTHSAPTA